ncbi:hypothetical protein D3C84_678680 [compost metagenome]
MAKEDRAGRMSHQMDLQIVAPSPDQVLQGRHQFVAAAGGQVGELGVFFHLAPDRTGEGAANSPFEEGVGSVLDILAQTAGTGRFALEHVGDDVRDGFEYTGLPDDEQRVAAIAQEEASHRPRTLDGGGLVVQSAVGVDHQALGLARLGTEPLVRQPAGLVQQ